jgi:putative transcriptional regulator
MMRRVKPRKIELIVASTQREVSEKLVELRKNQGLTQNQLSEMAGIDRKTINRIENGHFSPSVDTLIRLALTLQFPIGDLLSSQSFDCF